MPDRVLRVGSRTEDLRKSTLVKPSGLRYYPHRQFSQFLLCSASGEGLGHLFSSVPELVDF